MKKEIGKILARGRQRLVFKAGVMTGVDRDWCSRLESCHSSS